MGKIKQNHYHFCQLTETGKILIFFFFFFFFFFFVFMNASHKNNSSIYENIMITDKEQGEKNDTKLFTI